MKFQSVFDVILSSLSFSTLFLLILFEEVVACNIYENWNICGWSYKLKICRLHQKGKKKINLN